MVKVKMTNNSSVVKSAMEEAIQRALTTMGIGAEAHAKINLNKPMPHANGESRPYIDTGRVLNDINNTVQGHQMQLGVNVEYAIYLHEGTRYIQPNRFLRDAIADNAEEYKSILQQELQGTTL